MHFKTMGLVLGGVFLFGLSPLAGGQRPAPTLPGPGQAQTGKKNPSKTKEPSCAQEAGISQATMQQRRSIMESTRAQVQAICAQSISDAEKLEKIREIRRAAKQQMDALISSEQLQKLEECQKARGGQHAGAHPRTSHPGGPCAQSQSPQQPQQPQ
jgi:hypothetical protein